MGSIGHIFLIGFSGSGKTTVGTLLARHLGRSFLDTDALIEKQAGMSIRDIFASNGEPEFRRLEEKVITELAAQTRPEHVVALGGGAFENATNRRTTAAAGRIVYLSCSAREIHRRLKLHTDRPLLQPDRAGERAGRPELHKKIASLLATRRNNYRKAELTVSTTNRTPANVVKLIRYKLRSCDVQSQSRSR